MGFTDTGNKDYGMGTSANYAMYVKVVAPEDGTITDLNYHIRCTSGSELIKAVVWSSARNVLRIGGTTTITGLNWYQVSLSLSITNGTTYYIGFVRDSLGGNMNPRWDTNLGANYYGYDASNSYASPQAIVEVLGTQDVKFFANYDPTPTGPSLLVEGITPGKVEGVDWGDITDID